MAVGDTGAGQKKGGIVFRRSRSAITAVKRFRRTGFHCSRCKVKTCRLPAKNGRKPSRRYGKSPGKPKFSGAFERGDEADVYLNENRKQETKNLRIDRRFCLIIADYLLLNWGARRAALRPYFLRSFIRGSRVRKPAFLRSLRSSALYLSRAREIP